MTEAPASPPAESGDVVVRRAENGDLAAAARASGAAFGVDLEVEAHRRRWEERVGHLLATDPGGCFVAERSGRIIGVAQALVRERLWVLSLLAVDPSEQSGGAGRVLMERVLAYALSGGSALIMSSNDPRALRLYARYGFELRPTFQAAGAVDRRALPAAAAGVVDDDQGDLEALAAISRDVRGAPHTAELAFALRRGGRLLQLPGRGFAVTAPDRGVWLLVAREEEAAETLLWSALACVADLPVAAVRWLDVRQQWAIRIALRAGLSLSAHGAIATRGVTAPLHPFIPSAPFA